MVIPAKFDAILIGTGSGLELVNALIHENHKAKIAVIDRDEPGGICLTRGCIPSKILVSSADVIREIESANMFGIDASKPTVDFPRVMERMRLMVSDDINQIGRSLRSVPNVKFFQKTAEFTAPMTLSVDGKLITAPRIFLCTGSRPAIPPINGLEETGYLTSDTLLAIRTLPERLVIIGGGYIAAEYGHFFSAMGSEVTIIGRNPRFLHEEEPEISAALEKELGKYLTILNNCEVTSVHKEKSGKIVVATNQKNARGQEIVTDEILVAAGRSPNTDILHPERSGVSVDEKGWIIVNEHMETTHPGIWGFGDADGKFLFKHVANHEAAVVYYNAFLHKEIKVDYHAVPHAVFTRPEIASVGLHEREAISLKGEENILIGFQEFMMTAKGSALEARNAFVKVVLEAPEGKILGAHIIGPDASILLQEFVNAMYSPDPTIATISKAMHIHPALSEVVHGACRSLMPVKHYHHILKDLGYENEGS